MRDTMRKWLPALLVGGGYALSAAVHAQLPAESTADFGRLLPIPARAPLDAVDRPFVAFGLPTLALLLWLLMHDAPVRPLGRATMRRVWGDGVGSPVVEFHKFAPTYRLIVAWTVALVLSIHVAFLAIALAWPVEPGRIVGAVFGIGLLLVGNEMPRLRPNAVAGIRTAHTLHDPRAWARVHRLYGILWLAGGAVVLVVAAAAPRYALAAGIAALLLSSVAALALGDRGAARAAA